MPVDMSRYPVNWKQFSADIRFGRAAGRCECCGECGLHRTTPGPRRCTERHGEQAQWARGTVILTTAHLCECDPPCANPEHVKAMCQRCHLLVDVKLHVRNRHARRRGNLESAGQLTMEKGMG